MSVTLEEVNRTVQDVREDVRDLVMLVRQQNGRVGALETKVAVVETKLGVLSEAPPGAVSSRKGVAAGGVVGAAAWGLVEFAWRKFSGG